MLASTRRCAVLRLLTCFVLPFGAGGAFYATEYVQLRRPVAAGTVAPPPGPSVRLAVDSRASPDGKRYRVSGWVAQESQGQRQLLRPTLLVLGPDGKGTEFRVNLRRRREPPPRGDHGSFQGFEGFELEIKARHLPAARPLRLALAVEREGRRELLDTGVVLVAGRP